MSDCDSNVLSPALLPASLAFSALSQISSRTKLCLTSSHSLHFLLDEAGPYPLWLLVIRGIYSTYSMLFARSELKISSGWGWWTALSLRAQGKWSTRSAPGWSICLKCQLCRPLFCSYLVLLSPISHNPLSIMAHNLVSTSHPLELLLPTYFLVQYLSASLECKVQLW